MEFTPERVVRELAARPKVFKKAACLEADTELFFADDAATIRGIKPVCYSCDIMDACLLGAIVRKEPYGIWGASTPRQRRKLQRKPGYVERLARRVGLRLGLDERDATPHDRAASTPGASHDEAEVRDLDALLAVPPVLARDLKPVRRGLDWNAAPLRPASEHVTKALVPAGVVMVSPFETRADVDDMPDGVRPVAATTSPQRKRARRQAPAAARIPTQPIADRASTAVPVATLEALPGASATTRIPPMRLSAEAGHGFGPRARENFAHLADHATSEAARTFWRAKLQLIP